MDFDRQKTRSGQLVLRINALTGRMFCVGFLSVVAALLLIVSRVPRVRIGLLVAFGRLKYWWEGPAMPKPPVHRMRRPRPLGTKMQGVGVVVGGGGGPRQD